MAKKILVGFALLLVAGCETYTSLEASQNLKFITADRDFSFMNNAFPKGTSFEYVAVKGGRHAVWVNDTQASTVAGGIGAPVGMISVQNKNGMMLNENFCSTGEQLVNSIGITVIHPWEGYAVRKKITKGVCFK